MFRSSVYVYSISIESRFSSHLASDVVNLNFLHMVMCGCEIRSIGATHNSKSYAIPYSVSYVPTVSAKYTSNPLISAPGTIQESPFWERVRVEKLQLTTQLGCQIFFEFFFANSQNKCISKARTQEDHISHRCRERVNG